MRRVKKMPFLTHLLIDSNFFSSFHFQARKESLQMQSLSFESSLGDILKDATLILLPFHSHFSNFFFLHVLLHVSSLASHPSAYHQLGYSMAMKGIISLITSHKAIIIHFAGEILEKSLMSLCIFKADDQSIGTALEITSAIQVFFLLRFLSLSLSLEFHSAI